MKYIYTTFKKEKYAKLLIIFILVVLVFFVRKNTFGNFLINLDEAEWLYCLKRISSDFKPFIGFDAHTSGPFAVYLLSPLLFLKNFNVIDLRIYGIVLLCIPFILFLKKKASDFTIYSSVYTSFLLLYDLDFITYNTEWLILPLLYTIYFLFEKIQKENKLINILLISIIIIILPFVKFQTILFSIFYFGIICLFLLKKKNQKELLIFICFLLMISIILYLFFQLTGSYKELIDKYIIRNLNHAKLFNTEPLRDVFYEFRHTLFSIFKYHIILIFILLVFVLYKIGINKLYSNFKLDSIILSITLISVFIPKTNWHHYFILLFFILSIIISKLILLSFEKEKMKFLGLIPIILIMLFGSKKFEINNIKKNKIISPEITIIEKKIPKHSKIIILGWFQALPLYHKLLHQYEFINPTGHTFYTTLFRNIPNLYSKEISPIKILIKNKIEYLIDPENTMEILNDHNLNNIIKQNFVVISTFEKGYIYKKIL